ncbi:hypothetical protein FBEOM_11646 [Fusarium beomiforme]|uniref:Uncharacterized protein n=1 Tax=Fusarium beomiforme TaxID=44412 RepID=A0A9P5DU66_9HYPO|nr:hypothetical protein FBEOM_11646 [Fusarium beomiforme]
MNDLLKCAANNGQDVENLNGEVILADLGIPQPRRITREERIVNDVILLANERNGDILNLLEYHDKSMNDIARRVIENTFEPDYPWKFAEQCYREAISPSGDLSPDDYLSILDEVYGPSDADPQALWAATTAGSWHQD